MILDFKCYTYFTMCGSDVSVCLTYLMQRHHFLCIDVECTIFPSSGYLKTTTTRISRSSRSSAFKRVYYIWCFVSVTQLSSTQVPPCGVKSTMEGLSHAVTWTNLSCRLSGALRTRDMPPISSPYSMTLWDKYPVNFPLQYKKEFLETMNWRFLELLPTENCKTRNNLLP